MASWEYSGLGYLKDKYKTIKKISQMVAHLLIIY